MTTSWNWNVKGMTHRQWVSVSVYAVDGDLTLSVKNVTTKHGHFYKGPDKGSVLDNSDIEMITINRHKKGVISARGNKGASVGTDGSFELYDGEQKVGKYSWSCPYGKRKNTSKWEVEDKDKD